jgi:pSer/pThr/pTyr-binding forkhead associated (FHA) protein
MIICTNCKNEEFTGALFCSACGVRLDESTGVTTQSLNLSSASFSAPDTLAAEAIIAAPVISGQVTLHFIDLDVFITLPAKSDITIGRSNPGQIVLPDVDLSACDGYQLGVSRMHASIRTQNEKLNIRDLGSSNGTRLNGEKLTPQIPYPIQNGDVIALGRLKAQVILGG